ncbi:FAD-binding oxidoreductase [Catenovulum sediminis]|uniref:FAD-binding oxidoreductase n=1 Tax=Catenovulum sediminis TaxID=1740262 RepID=A0ABV1RIR7_9ALTE
MKANKNELTQKIKNRPLYDYGKLYTSAASYSEYRPSSISEVQDIIRQARTLKQKVRVRGSGHTFNGCTLPSSSELLIRTDNLNWYRFNEFGSITVGAGALMWDIRDFVSSEGFVLPVYNGGWAGPTLGGYINAGGFGKGSLSDEHGGFWENVLSITIVNGLGELQVVERNDLNFKWLFSSYGQLGIVVEAKLKILPKSIASYLFYTEGGSGRIPKIQSDDPKDNDQLLSTTEKKLFWFSLLISSKQEKIAWQALQKFCQENPDVIPDGGWAGPLLNQQPIGYHYNVQYKEFNPPLLYPYNEDFIVVGVMCYFDVGTEKHNLKIKEIEREFISLALKNKLFLYLQAENIGRNIDFCAYYGESIYEQFKLLKRQFDPEFIINPNVHLKLY